MSFMLFICIEFYYILDFVSVGPEGGGKWKGLNFIV